MSIGMGHDDPESALRDATEQFLVGDAPGLADELAEALLAISVDVGGLRRRLPPQSPHSKPMREIDDAFSQCVALARRLSVAVRAQGDPGAYADAARVTRDLGRRLASAMPDGTTLNVVCPPSPVVATIPQPELRRVLATLVRRLMVGLVGHRGELAMEVTEVPRGPGQEPTIELLIGHGELGPVDAEEAADHVRPGVNARGGSVESCVRRGGGAMVVVSLPSAC
jgi:hypothetical protein